MTATTENKQPMRLGEWLEKNVHLYFRIVNVWTPSSSGAGSMPVQLESRTLEIIERYDFVRMMRDYDKHIDDFFRP